MKPTSPLSLLLFLHLVSGIPIPTRVSFTPSDCHYGSCAPSLRTALILSKPNTPPTKLSEPHFPSHQLSSSKQILDEIYDNTPRTPPKTISPTAALTAKHPLSSNYLLSLANPASDTTTPLPSKPTSELPKLRKKTHSATGPPSATKPPPKPASQSWSCKRPPTPSNYAGMDKGST